MTSTASTASIVSLTSHHYRFANEWSMWRWIGLRGAGFAADLVLPLGSPDVAATLDRVVELEPRVQHAREAAIAQLERDIAQRTAEDRKPIGNALRKLRNGSIPATPPGVSDEALAALRAITGQADEARAIAERTLTEERARASGVLRGLAADPTFREAIAWQNRQALHSCLDVVLRQPPGASTSKTRQHERTIASYLQRYAMKNDSIGFFGPVGWATIGEQTVVRPGPSLVRSRTVYFEHWAVDTLAAQLALDPALRPYLAPRLKPTVALVDTTLHHSMTRTSTLPADVARILAACDGERSALEIAEELAADGELSAEDVLDMFGQLAEQGVLLWTIEIPTQVEHPERALADVLARIPDEVGEAARAKLAQLEDARAAVAAAAGDAAAIDTATRALEDVFTSLTDVAGQRRSGETYAGRGLIYEDCVRDVDVELAPALVDSLGSPLSLLLAACRWYTYTLAQRYREAFVALHAELAREVGSSTVPFMLFYSRATELFSSDTRSAPPLVASVASELQRRWVEILALDDAAMAQPHRAYSSQALAAKVAEAFDAPHPGWPSARQHSPDLMIAAQDPAALARGELTAVLGELHAGIVTFAPWMAKLHPKPEELEGAWTHDIPQPLIASVIGKERFNRAAAYSTRQDDFDLEIGLTKSARPRSNVLGVASLVVEPAGETLVIRSLDGAGELALEEVFDTNLSTQSASAFRPLPPAPHTPRITLDNLVISRESWRCEVASIGLAACAEPLDRMLAVRRYARAHGMPRFMFYKVPQETKPCYLDLASPHYVEQFAYLTRNATHVSLSELLPAHDGTWLSDADGARYTSELRVVVVDDVAWPGASPTD